MGGWVEENQLLRLFPNHPPTHPPTYAKEERRWESMIGMGSALPPPPPPPPPPPAAAAFEEEDKEREEDEEEGERLGGWVGGSRR